jgi:hypothetical protein
MPHLDELIKMVIRSSQPPLCDQLKPHVISDFKELKLIGERIDRVRLRMKRPSDPLRLQLGPPQPIFNQYNVICEPEQYCVYHRAKGHRTEYCVGLKEELNVRASEMGEIRSPKKPQSPERPHNVNVVTNSDVILYPAMAIKPINEPEPDIINDEIQTNERTPTNSRP